MSTSSIKRQIRRFHVVTVQRTSKKCTKKSDAREELLFWSLNLLLLMLSLDSSESRRQCQMNAVRWRVTDGKIVPNYKLPEFPHSLASVQTPPPLTKGEGRVCIQTGYTYLGLHQEEDILNLQCFCLKKINLIISANLGSRNLNGSLLYCFCTLAISSAYLLEKRVNLKLNQ